MVNNEANYQKGDRVKVKDGRVTRMATIVADGIDNNKKVRVRIDDFPFDKSIPVRPSNEIYVIEKMAKGGNMKNLDKIKNSIGTELYKHIGSLNESQLKKQLSELRLEIKRLSNKKDSRYYKLKDEEFLILHRLEKTDEFKYAKGGGVGKGKNQKVKDWYVKNYPDDELGKELDDYVTFDSLWRYLGQGENVYEVLGVGDSLIRERVFEHLAKVNKVGYDYIYNKWLGRYAKGGGLLGGFNYSIGGL